MTVYLCMIVLTLIIALIGQSTRKTYIDSRGEVVSQISGIYVLLIAILWCLIYIVRGDSVGADTSGYKYFYNYIGSQSMTEFLESQRDFLFGYMEYFCYKISDGSWIFFQLVSSVMTYLPVLLVFRKKGESFAALVLLYIFTLHYYDGFNGMRQAIAVSCVLVAYYCFFVKGKHMGYMAWILIAFGFHSSVLFAIPFHFLSKCNIRGYAVKITAVLMGLSYLSIWRLWPYMIVFLERIGQTKMAQDYAEVAVDQGSGYLRVLVCLLPVLVSLPWLKKLNEKYKDANGELVLILFSALFMLLSTRYWIFARVAQYLSVGSIMFLPKLYNTMFTRYSKRLGAFLILGLYFIYMIALLLHGEGGYYPYVFSI